MGTLRISRSLGTKCRNNFDKESWSKVSVEESHESRRWQQKVTKGTTNRYRLDFVRAPSSDCGGFAWCDQVVNQRPKSWPETSLAPSLWQSTSPFWRRARRKFDLGVKWVTSLHVHSPGHEKASARHIVSKWKNVLRSCSLNTSPTIIEFRAFQAAHACHASSCVSSHIINDFPTKPAPGRGHRVLHLLKKMHPCKGWVIKEASFL